MVDIADVPFSAVPEDEQNQFVAKPREFGEPKGYKQRKAWVSSVHGRSIDSGHRMLIVPLQTREYGVLDEMHLYSSACPW